MQVNLMVIIPFQPIALSYQRWCVCVRLNRKKIKYFKKITLSCISFFFFTIYFLFLSFVSYRIQTHIIRKKWVKQFIFGILRTNNIYPIHCHCPHQIPLDNITFFFNKIHILYLNFLHFQILFVINHEKLLSVSYSESEKHYPNNFTFFLHNTSAILP